MTRPSALPERVRATLQATDRVIASVGDALFAFDRDTRCVHFGPGMERITGLSAAEVLGRSVLDALPFADAGDENHRAVLRGETRAVHNQRFSIPETDRQGFYDAYYSPLADEQQIVGGVAVVRDTTEQRRIQQQMEETENRFRNMADAAPVLLWMAGTDSLCNFFNQTWLDFTGRTFDEEWGVGWAEGVHFEDLQRCIDVYQEAFARRQKFDMIYRLRRRDGEYRWLLDCGAPRYAPDRTFAGFIGSCIDITDRKILEDELRHAVDVRDEFISIAAHELRTPLTPLQLGLQHLLHSIGTQPGPLEGVARKLAKLEGHVTRQARLVESLLDVSRLSGAPVLLEIEAFDLAEVVREVTRQFTDEAQGAATDLVIEADGVLLGYWDRPRLEQIVRNLLSNALKYGRGKPVEIAVDRDADGDARIRVRDHGIGIAAEDQARIFGRFSRAVPPRSFPGFGLGLWITSKLVHAHRGSISVTSVPGDGALFVVTLPINPNRSDATERSSSTRVAR